MMYMFTVCKCIKDDNNSEGEKERQRNVSTKCERRSKDAHIQDRKKLIDANHARLQSIVRNNFQETFRLIKWKLHFVCSKEYKWLKIQPEGEHRVRL